MVFDDKLTNWPSTLKYGMIAQMNHNSKVLINSWMYLWILNARSPFYSRVATMEKKIDEKKTKPAPKSPSQSKSKNAESDDEDEDFEEFFDWRNKK